MALVRYWNSMESKGKSAVITAGVKQMFVHVTVVRQPRSEIASPNKEENCVNYMSFLDSKERKR